MSDAMNPLFVVAAQAEVLPGSNGVDTAGGRAAAGAMNVVAGRAFHSLVDTLQLRADGQRSAGERSGGGFEFTRGQSRRRRRVTDADRMHVSQVIAVDRNDAVFQKYSGAPDDLIRGDA